MKIEDNLINIKVSNRFYKLQNLYFRHSTYFKRTIPNMNQYFVRVKLVFG